jgi:hypothetical protein
VLKDLEKIRKKQGFDPKDFGLTTDFATFDGLLCSVKSPDKGSSKENDDSVDSDDSADFDPFRQNHQAMMEKIAKKAQELKQQDEDLSKSETVGLSVSSDLICGLILAGDILHKKTALKRFNRKIYLLTDAECKMQLDEKKDEFGQVLAGLKRMEVEFTVIGLDFKTQGEYDEHGTLKKKAKKREKTKTDLILEMGGAAKDNKGGESGSDKDSESDVGGSDESDGSDQSDGSDGSDGDDDEISVDDEVKRQIIKRENEKTLMSVAKQTRGKVIAARNLIEMMKVAGAKRIPKSTKKRFALNIAPGLTVEAEYSLLISKANMQTLKVHALNYDDSGNVMKDADEMPIYSEITKESSYRDPNNQDEEMDPKYKLKAYKYGASYVPVNAYDELDLVSKSPVEMHIMGYTSRDTIPISCLIDSGYAVTGGTSNRGQVAISAIAQGLQEEKKVAIAKFVKTTDADPIVGVLLPMQGDTGEKSHLLVFVQMPFAEDLSKSTFRTFGESEVDEVRRVGGGGERAKRFAERELEYDVSHC